MKKIGIITIYNSNYGNRLQNYAMQESLKNFGYSVETIKNVSLLNKRKNNFEYLLRNFKYFFKKDDFNDGKDREKFFIEFNKFIKTTPYCFNWFNLKKLNNFDEFVIGSDQVWNPNLGRLTKFDLASFTDKKKISYAASFGVSKLPNIYNELLYNNLIKFENISVRENAGNEILNNIGIDSEVVLDPTMLLTSKDWKKVEKKPLQYNGEKYILNYFLGGLSYEYKKIIDDFAKKNNCKVINILDKNDPFYLSGPSEFLYLEENAFLICTDSFHSSVFSIIFNRPFVVFDRNDTNIVNMNSRLETLLKKFKLESRKFSGILSNDYLKHDYSISYKILEEEKLKSIDFLKSNL